MEDDAEHDASRSPSPTAQERSVRAAELRWDGSRGPYVVRGSGGSDRSIPLRLPKSIGKPETSWFSLDGRWLALPSEQGPLLLFDLQRSDSPIAVLGERGLNWLAVEFDDHRARIIATSVAGERRVWRHFNDVNALMAFAKRSLPVESAGAGTPPEPVHLNAAELCKLRGGTNLFALSGARGDPSESCD